jgi:hypothetical protein
MTFRRLFLFVEGDDDERFFRSVLLPSLQSAYQDVQFVQFTRLKKEKVQGFLRSIAGMKADYIFVHDMDQLPCATAAREKLLKIFPQVDADRLQVVKAEIESWYCAGLPEGDPWESLVPASPRHEHDHKGNLRGCHPPQRRAQGGDDAGDPGELRP